MPDSARYIYNDTRIIRKRMEIKRIKRYKDKINVIVERSEEISEWTEGYEAEDFTRDEKTKLAAYKAF